MPLAPALRGQAIQATADVRLVGEHGEVEEMHSILLMVISPYFVRLLENEQTDYIKIDNANRDILKLIKEFAYEGKLTGLSDENVDLAFKVADQYCIMGILEEIESFKKKQKMLKLHEGINYN